MHRKVVFVLSLLVMFSVVATGMTWGADQNIEKSFEIESASDPTVCDYDSVVDSVGGYTVGHAGLSLCGKASQTNPPWLYLLKASPLQGGDAVNHPTAFGQSKPF